jgi:glycosyltransferase involved in cell wall biosynthesis
LVTPNASVVICSYSDVRWHYLLEAVTSLRRQTVQAHEVVVVVDHNPDLLERVTRAIPDARVVPNEFAPGLSGSRNSGTAACGGEVLAFLDDDAVAAPDWLDRLLQHYVEPNVAGVGGSVETVWEEGRPRWFPPEFDWVVGCGYLGLPTTTARLRNLLGCNMSFRRLVLLEAGGFRDGLGRQGGVPLGCEETELCIRIHQRWPEYAVLYEPGAKVRHHVPARRSRVRYFVQRCYAEGLSKAQVTRTVGPVDGLAVERRYVRSTLPEGIRRELADCASSRTLNGLRRAAAITSGLVLTAAGYGAGLLGHIPWRHPLPLEQFQESTP